MNGSSVIAAVATAPLPVPLGDTRAALRCHDVASPRPEALAAKGPLGLWLQPVVQADPSAARYAQALSALGRRGQATIGLHLRLPFCAVHSLCTDEDLLAAQPAAAFESCLQGLMLEAQQLAQRLGGRRELALLHLGGGCANLLTESQLARLVHAVRTHWHLPADAEMSILCDARRTGWVQLRLLRGLGFRQVMFELLDLDPVVQLASGCLQSADLVDDACSLARSCGIDCIHLGLQVGLPHQTVPRWRASLERLIAIGPDRVRLSRFVYRPQSVAAHVALDADTLPDEATCHALQVLAATMLRDVGYHWVGADQFALDGDALVRAQAQGRLHRTALGNTAASLAALLGLGVGAVSDIGGRQFWNEPSMPAWLEAVQAGRLAATRAALADRQTLQRRAAQTQLLCRFLLPSTLARDGLEVAYRQLAAHAQDGLVQVQADSIVLTEAGRHHLLALCSDAPPPPPGAAAQWAGAAG